MQLGDKLDYLYWNIKNPFFKFYSIFKNCFRCMYNLDNFKSLY